MLRDLGELLVVFVFVAMLLAAVFCAVFVTVVLPAERHSYEVWCAESGRNDMGFNDFLSLSDEERAALLVVSRELAP